MPRSRFLLPFSVAALLLGTAGSVRADEPKPASNPEPKVPTLSTDQDAAAAVALFKEEFKAKGLKGEERTSQRDWAMSKVVKVQHPAVVEALADVAKGTNEATLRTLAVLYLGEQKALPGPAGRAALTAMEKNKKDLVLTLSGLDTIAGLRFLGAGDTLRDHLKGDEFVLKKAAIVAAGKTRDIRLLPDLLRLLGIDSKGDGSGEDVVVEEGYSWEGAEATVDTGTAGDGDQKAAEAEAKAKMAANEAAAKAAAGGKGAGENRGKGGASRSIKELAPHVLKAVKEMTGQDFVNGKAIVEWLANNKDWLAKEKARVAELAKAQ